MAADGGQWGEWWTLPRLSHPEELFELVRDTVNQPVGSGNVEDGANPVDTLAEVAEVATHKVTKSGSDVQVKEVDFGSSGFVHAVIIGTGRDGLGSVVCHLSNCHTPARSFAISSSYCSRISSIKSSTVS